MTTVLEVIENLQRLEQEQVIVADIWQAEDIRQKAIDMDMEMTDEQVLSVLRYISDKHDASVGINWDIVENAINHCMRYEDGKN